MPREISRSPPPFRRRGSPPLRYASRRNRRDRSRSPYASRYSSPTPYPFSLFLSLGFFLSELGFNSFCFMLRCRCISPARSCCTNMNHLLMITLPSYSSFRSDIRWTCLLARPREFCPGFLNDNVSFLPWNVIKYQFEYGTNKTNRTWASNLISKKKHLKLDSTTNITILNHMAWKWASLSQHSFSCLRVYGHVHSTTCC